MAFAAIAFAVLWQGQPRRYACKTTVAHHSAHDHRVPKRGSCTSRTACLRSCDRLCCNIDYFRTLNIQTVSCDHGCCMININKQTIMQACSQRRWQHIGRWLSRADAWPEETQTVRAASCCSVYSSASLANGGKRINVHPVFIMSTPTVHAFV
jgi:hypothetical protein